MPKMKYRYLHFKCMNWNKEPEERVWACNSRQGGPLGIVVWYEGWKCFVFQSSKGAVFSSECLKDIGSFCQEVTDETRERVLDKICRLFGQVSDTGWTKALVTERLRRFKATQGREGVVALGRYIDWAESHEKKAGEIAATVGHDLNDCETDCFSPRTGNY